MLIIFSAYEMFQKFHLMKQVFKTFPNRHLAMFKTVTFEDQSHLFRMLKSSISER